MTSKQAAVLARRAWLEQEQRKRLEFYRWLYRVGWIGDWPAIDAQKRRRHERTL